MAITIATSTGYSAAWIGQLAKRYNAEGPAGMVNRQQTRIRATPTLLSSVQLDQVSQASADSEPPSSYLGSFPREVGGFSTVHYQSLLEALLDGLLEYVAAMRGGNRHDPSTLPAA